MKILVDIENKKTILSIVNNYKTLNKTRFS